MSDDTCSMLQFHGNTYNLFYSADGKLMESLGNKLVLFSLSQIICSNFGQATLTEIMLESCIIGSFFFLKKK